MSGNFTELLVSLGLKPGPVVIADGGLSAGRSVRTGEQAVSNVHGFYYEQASRSNVFSLVLTAWTSTIAAGNILGAAAAASTQFAVWNPTGSGKNLALLRFSVNPISGTAPVSGLWHSFSATAPTIANSAVTPLTCHNLALGSGGSVAGYLTSAGGAALTGSSALKVIRAAGLSISAGTFANLGGLSYEEYIDGDIIIPPGFCWVPTWAAAGTTFLGGYSVTWEEVPI